MLYQIAIGLHKLVNSCDFPNSFEHITFLDQVICTSRQLRFQILRKFNSKIGLNETANKFSQNVRRKLAALKPWLKRH